MSCNYDFTYEVKGSGRKSKPMCILTTGMQAGPVRRTHDMLSDGTHVIDQGSQLRVIRRNGQKAAPPMGCRSNEVTVVDICGMKGRNDTFAVLLKGTSQTEPENGVVLHTLPNDGPAEQKLFVRFPADVHGVKMEARLRQDDTSHIVILMSDGSLREIDVDKCLEMLAKGSITLAMADAATKGAVTTVMTGLATPHLSVSTDGRVLCVVRKDGTITTVNADTFAVLCVWRPVSDTPITTVRVVPGISDDVEVKSHMVLVLYAEAPNLVLYHVKAKEGVWHAWKVQTMTLAGIKPSLLEVGCNGDVGVVASKDHATLVAFRLSVATTAGCIIRGANHLDCDAAMGTFVSIVAKSEKEGVRFSCRRTEGLVLHDIDFSEISALPKEHNDRTARTMDELDAQVKRLEAENARLLSENTHLHNKKQQDIPPEFEQTLKETTKMVNDTCSAMIKFHNEISDRLGKLEADMKATHETQANHAREAEKQFKTANTQVVQLIKDSAQKDVDLMKELQLAGQNKLRRAQEDTIKEYERIAADATKKRMQEAKYLSDGLSDCIKSLLSEPGLARLKEMVTNSAFTPQSEADEAAVKQTIQQSLQGDLKQHLESTVSLILQQEKESLNQITGELIGKSTEIVGSVREDVARELKLGLEKLTADDETKVDAKWQNQAERRLQELLTEGRDVISRIGNASIEVSVELLIAKRRIKRAVEKEELWKDINEVVAANESIRDDLLSYLFELAPVPPPTRTIPENEVYALLRPVYSLATMLNRKIGSCTASLTGPCLLYLQTCLELLTTRPDDQTNALLSEVKTTLAANKQKFESNQLPIYQRVLTM